MTAFYNTESGAVWFVPAVGDAVTLRSASSKMDAYDAFGEAGGYVRTGEWLPAYGPVLQCAMRAVTIVVRWVDAEGEAVVTPMASQAEAEGFLAMCDANGVLAQIEWV